MVKISKYLDPQSVMFLDVATRDEVLKALVERLNGNKKLKDDQDFFKAIMNREKIVSTGIGMGVAIPHAKLPNYDDFFIGIAVLQKGVEWHALDHAAVRLVFMIGGPDDKQTEYLQILSTLTAALKDEARRKKMLNAGTPEALIDLLSGY